MDTLQNISYTHRFWVFLLPLVLMAADVVTGWIQASVNGTWDSTKMRKGLYRKSGELLTKFEMPADVGQKVQDIQRLMWHANSNTTMPYIALDNVALAEISS